MADKREKILKEIDRIDKKIEAALEDIKALMAEKHDLEEELRELE